MTSPDWNREPIRRGTQRMLDLRSERLEAGEKPIGWKLGFGAPAALERFGLSGPLLGFLNDATVHDPGSTVSCEGWKNPVAEPEVAVYIGDGVGSGQIEHAIAALGPAIELADVHPPPDDIEEVLAGDIYHRAVIFGRSDPGRAGGLRHGLRGRVVQDGVEVVDTTDIEAFSGELIEIVGHAADLLAAAGEGLKPGDVIITGSIIPPLAIEPGQQISFELSPFPAITVNV